MTLIEAREIGKDCGLETDRECVDNIFIHATNLFDYVKMGNELMELQNEYIGTCISQYLLTRSF